MKLTFLGVSGLLDKGFSSNMLLDIGDKTLLIDCGGDIKHSIRAASRKPKEIDAVYISHLHSDHAAGLEWLGYYFYFVLHKRPTLYIHESMISDLWGMLRPGMEKLHRREIVTLDEYFSFVVIPTNDSWFSFGGEKFYVHPESHVESLDGNAYSYSLLCYKEHSTWQENKFYISTDTNKINIYESKFIFHDCDVMNLDGVHANYNDLKKVKDRRRKKMWLYHYHDLGDNMPDAVKDGFAGFVKQGQIFEI